MAKKTGGGERQFHKLKLVNDFASSYGTRVFVDDNELRGVTAVDFSVSVNEIPHATIEIIPMADFDATCVVDCIVKETVPNAVKYLREQLLEDERLYKAFVASIDSAIDDCADADLLSEFIADRIIGKR